VFEEVNLKQLQEENLASIIMKNSVGFCISYRFFSTTWYENFCVGVRDDEQLALVSISSLGFT
jgi:hypothetical protein